MKIFKKIFIIISPTLGMLTGNKKRVTMLLEKVENLEESNNQKTDVILQKVENLEKSLSALRKEYSFLSYNENINILGNKINVSKKGNSKVEHYKCNNEAFFDQIKNYILKTDVVLDIGCGIRPQSFFVPNVHICIEPFEQYRDVVKPFFPNRSYFIFLKEEALRAIRMMDDNSVDTVFMIDLIEHLEKEEGLSLLREADRVARKQIIVFTPLGFYPMHYEKSGEKDAWGLDGTDVQEHKSGWFPEDFGDSWDFHICEDCHEAFLPEEKLQGKKYSALMAIKTKNFDGFAVQDETPEFVKNLYKERMNSSFD